MRKRDRARKPSLSITPADQEELELVLAILEESARWMTARGFGGWRPGSFSREEIRDQIAQGEVFLARKGSEIVGTITLQWSDMPFWGVQPPDAGYVHKLAIKREFGGSRIGVEILRWAENKASGMGKKYLRLNCMADNIALMRYYERLGFDQNGEIIEPRGRAALLEKQLK